MLLRFDRGGTALSDALHAHGTIPLPPYIRGGVADARDDTDYQTIFARTEGAVAAPRPPCHFTPTLLDALVAAGIRRTMVTLHVGAGTFLPVKVEDTRDHVMHAETGILGEETAASIAETRRRGGRVVAVGTTSLRLIETAAGEDGTVRPFAGETSIFITPGYRFKATDLLADQFPPTALDTFHARRRLCRARPDEIGPMSTPRPAATVSIPMAIAACSIARMHDGAFRPSPFWPATARRGAAGSRPHMARSRRRPSCRSAPPARSRACCPTRVAETGAEILLGNTYHLMLRPGAERVERLGGLHRMMGWTSRS